MEPLSQLPRLLLPNVDGYTVINLANIVYCEASGNYSKIVLSDGNETLIAQHLGKLEEILPTDQFYRTHHSCIIHLKWVDNIVRQNSSFFIQADKYVCPLARSRLKALKDRYYRL